MLDFREVKINVRELLEKYKEGRISFHKNSTSSSTIENVLLKIPHTLILDYRNNNKLIIIGDNILKEIFDFINGKNTLTNTRYFKEIENTLFDHLPKHKQERLLNFMFTGILIVEASDEDLSHFILSYQNKT